MAGDRWKFLGSEPFWRLVDKDAEGGCWRWLGKHDRNGYGQVSIDHTTTTAHRRAYELLVGVVSDGLVLDHLCKVRGCVNPAHLEPVTQRENLMRSPTLQAINAAKTECVHGHPFDEANTYWWRRPDGSLKRSCRTCNAERNRRHQRRRRAAASQGG